ncbi:MAG: hypothetical protein ACYDC5_12000 [Candidatus Dormibacteria bacterium]
MGAAKLNTVAEGTTSPLVLVDRLERKQIAQARQKLIEAYAALGEGRVAGRDMIEGVSSAGHLRYDLVQKAFVSACASGAITLDSQYFVAPSRRT